MGIRELFPEYDDLEKSVARELRRQRRAHDITLKDMADRLGMHPNTLGKYEKPEFNLGLELLYGYARVCDCPLSTFVSSPRELPVGQPTESPVADLSADEALHFTAVMHKLYAVLGEEQIALSREALLELSRIMATAVKR